MCAITLNVVLPSQLDMLCCIYSTFIGDSYRSVLFTWNNIVIMNLRSYNVWIELYFELYNNPR